MSSNFFEKKFAYLMGYDETVSKEISENQYNIYLNIYV